MKTYQENFDILTTLIVTRNKNNIREVRTSEFWINDVDHKIEIVFQERLLWLHIENPRQKPISIIPIDGNDGVLPKAGLKVSADYRFQYQYTRFSNSLQRQEIELRNAGPCDCLILDERWRFFEFKNGPSTGSGELSAVSNREKGEKQLARTMTYVREHASTETADAIFEGVLVVKPDFPQTPAVLIERGYQFFLDYQARLIEINTNNSYTL